jgi:hypothetical protein
MNRMKSKNSRLMFALFALGVIIFAIAMFNATSKEAVDAIDSFEECAAAGHPIMESYPERCAVPGGDTFTKHILEY